jgi:hypothetical protein
VEGVSVDFSQLSPTLNINLHWETVSERDVPAQIHKSPYPKSATPAPTGPQIYRWVLRNCNGVPVAMYIGQTREMKRRLYGYCHGHQRPTDQLNRIRDKFREVESSGGSVELQLLQFDPFSLNGFEFSKKRLAFAPARHMLENLLLCEARTKGVELLNKDCDGAGRNVKLV